MNRIILIGNGFDLAHNLKTKYGNFIDDFWDRQAKEIRESEDWIIQEQKVEETRKTDQFKKTVYFENDYFKLKYEKNFKWHELRDKVEYKNKFLEEINKAQKIENWLDVEKMYFKELKRCKNIFKKHELSNLEDAIEPIKKLNSDFEEITKELEKYLLKEMRDKKLINDDGTVNYDYEKELQVEFKKIIFEGRCKGKDERCEKILLLNFNYTNTGELYQSYEGYGVEKKNLKIIHIHGKLADSENQMIFGYGDEKSEESKEIENLDDNRFLANVKSVRYTETNNYIELEDFIKDPYMVVVLGHSCGNSDRTLLKMLFEGDNCKEIIVYYYFDPQDLSDNFNDIRNNIYRNFDDKGIFRIRLRDKRSSDRIPNKDLLSGKNTLELFIERNLVEIIVPNKDFKYKLLEDKENTDFIINNYYIGKYQVTQTLWESVMGNTPSHFDGKDLPVENVNWYEVVEFCNRLSNKFNLSQYYNINGEEVSTNKNAKGFRLPTEAEWEYAARGGKKGKDNKYAGCNRESELKDYAWYEVNSKAKTNPVGKLNCNELGIYDMSGNVWEWCDDWYDDSRVKRGGSWRSDGEVCRVSVRANRRPIIRGNFIGFRLACSS